MFVAVVLVVAAAAAALVSAVVSAGRAAASAADAAARYAFCVCASFFVIHNADASSPDIDPHTSGRSPQAVESSARHQVAV